MSMSSWTWRSMAFDKQSHVSMHQVFKTSNYYNKTQKMLKDYILSPFSCDFHLFIYFCCVSCVLLLETVSINHFCIFRNGITPTCTVSTTALWPCPLCCFFPRSTRKQEMEALPPRWTAPRCVVASARTYNALTKFDNFSYCDSGEGTKNSAHSQGLYLAVFL